jgi:hypothetical protein
MSDIGPKKEPVAWATATGLVLAALASYGLDVTPELKELLILAVPIIAGAAWARWQVTPVPKAQEAVKEARAEGFVEGVDAAAAPVPPEQWGINQGRYGTTVGPLYRPQGERVAE